MNPPTPPQKAWDYPDSGPGVPCRWSAIGLESRLCHLGRIGSGAGPLFVGIT